MRSEGTAEGFSGLLEVAILGVVKVRLRCRNVVMGTHGIPLYACDAFQRDFALETELLFLATTEPLAQTRHSASFTLTLTACKL